MFRKVLIANRGEIAVRIIRACREHDLRTVAVHSSVDRGASFVEMADEAVDIGGTTPAESYLNIPALIEAARGSGAEAIHPGYGFLSENPAFARACDEAGLVFIGPPAPVLEAMGDKIRARQIMKEAGVGVIPSSDHPDPLEAAREIGFPVLIKAAAGGGGRGMRRVADPAAFPAALESAIREAAAAFGDGRVFVERYIDHPRHVEVQVLADRHGNVAHLYERDCSLQRRHQKVVEEAPCPVLTSEMRERITRAGIAAARAAGYVNAGTVEFVLAPDGSFYFLEMNTRLQVEHPVTEAILDLDLVSWQLRIAAGERLDPALSSVTARGHAIECRLYAEDPSRGFLPSAGPLLALTEPTGPGVRFDSGVREGDVISPYYDPLIAKLICWGEDREAARRRMVRALEDCRILGIRTNLDFLLAIMRSEPFREGRVDTHLLESAGFLTPVEERERDLALAAVLLERESPVPAGGDRAGARVPESPWQTLGSKRFP